jgi:hypothetical protein
VNSIFHLKYNKQIVYVNSIFGGFPGGLKEDVIPLSLKNPRPGGDELKLSRHLLWA